MARIVPFVELRSVRLDWCNSAVNGLFTAVPRDWTSSARIRRDTRFVGKIADDVFRAFAFLVLTWNLDEHAPGATPGDAVVEVGAPGPDEEPSDVEVSAQFELIYQLPGMNDFSEQDLEDFAEFNATFNAWPYWRELVQSMTVRMGLSPYTVPVMRVTSRARPVVDEVDDQTDDEIEVDDETLISATSQIHD